ncbi:hypothetical protein CEXT_344691 [Caerostris extrusa]|uniref:Uncharacterized protein n=1 Tax=Caerostris extrusa TaxID=172846 RepID=A0AAV4P3H5_CAEEX|nr:hypothetical protein CEXT_344691 [Caerostris extrusa]
MKWLRGHLDILFIWLSFHCKNIIDDVHKSLYRNNSEASRKLENNSAACSSKSENERNLSPREKGSSFQENWPVIPPRGKWEQRHVTQKGVAGAVSGNDTECGLRDRSANVN